MGQPKLPTLVDGGLQTLGQGFRARWQGQVGFEASRGIDVDAHGKVQSGDRHGFCALSGIEQLLSLGQLDFGPHSFSFSKTSFLTSFLTSSRSACPPDRRGRGVLQRLGPQYLVVGHCNLVGHRLVGPLALHCAMSVANPAWLYRPAAGRSRR